MVMEFFFGGGGEGMRLPNATHAHKVARMFSTSHLLVFLQKKNCYDTFFSLLLFSAFKL